MIRPPTVHLTPAQARRSPGHPAGAGRVAGVPTEIDWEIDSSTSQLHSIRRTVLEVALTKHPLSRMSFPPSPFPRPLRDVLDRVSTHPASRIDDLLPDRWVLPDPSHGRRA